MRERWPLAAVVFDAGGTLVRLDFEWMSELLDSLGMRVSAIALRRAEVHGRRRYDLSSATPHVAGAPPLGSSGDTWAYFSGMLEAAGVAVAAIPAVVERLKARHADCGLWTRPVEGARAMLERVAALGVRRAVVSNSDGRAEMHLTDCGVRDGLEFVVDSHHVGVEKPAARIFEIALERLSVPPERALYVGDIVSVDVRGAREAGMQVVLIDPYRDYAPRGVMQIPHIGALPAWIAEHCVPVRTHRATREPNTVEGAAS
jgi:putative hydrolase of the HAD superfamily